MREATHPNGRSSTKLKRPLDRFEEDLLAAKNLGKVYVFDLAVSTRQTDSEGTIRGTVCQVDKYFIQIKPSKGNSLVEKRPVWIAKSMIVTSGAE